VSATVPSPTVTSLAAHGQRPPTMPLKTGVSTHRKLRFAHPARRIEDDMVYSTYSTAMPELKR
jgi:hypothetical protein